MIIRRRPFRPVASEAYSLDRDEPRSPGIHVMALVVAIESLLGRSAGQRKAGQSDLELYASAGFLWERVIADAMAASDRNVFRPGEFAWCYECHALAGPGVALPGSWGRKHADSTGHNLIYGTPDGVSQDLTSLEEYKFTWKSDSRVVTLASGELSPDGKLLSDDWVEDDTLEFGMWRWVVQTKAYCWMLGLESATIRVAHCNGNYRPMMPRAWEISLQFTPEELHDNWFMLVKQAVAAGWRME
jgi:hypothetical protein